MSDRRTETPPRTGTSTRGLSAIRARLTARAARAGPDVAIIALGAAMAAVSILLYQAAGFSHPVTVREPRVSPWLLAVMFACTEGGLVVYLRVRRGSHALTLGEIPMILGLVGMHPGALLIARLAGGAVGLVFALRLRGVKLGFNLALFAIETVVAAALFHLVAGSAAEVGPLQWAAAYGAMLAKDALAVVLVTATMSLRDDPGEWRRLPAAMRSVPLVTVPTTIALVGVLVIQQDARAVMLLAVLSVLAYVAYRGYGSLSQGHAQVEQLYAFTRALGGSSLDSYEVVRVVLDSARDQLRAKVAELVLPGEPGGPMVRTRLTGRADLESSPLDADPGQTWWAAAARGEQVLLPAGTHGEIPSGAADGMAVPVTIDDGATGVLIVTDSLSDIPTFGEDDIRLFRAVANHAGVALTKARLVDQLRREAAEKEHLALHDPLTELPNRRQFHRLLTDVLAGDEAGRIAAVMLMDLDRFKEINDALGHDVGDDVLVEVGTRLQRCLGARGVLARLGGDEFAVLLPRIASGADALTVAKDLNRELAHPIRIGDLTLNTKASIGIALAPEHGDATKTLLQHADTAMYAAKGTVEGVQFYDRAHDRNTPRRLALIADLQNAIELRELRVAFQPKADARSGAVTGAEALARWDHPEYGVIPPDEFIPIAEHTGMIRGLTLHVLEVALRECAIWRRGGHGLSVAVNVSPSGLLDTSFPDDVTRLLALVGVPADALILEITETSIMSDPTRVRVVLDRLNALGVRLSIDDFGTGYSSLGRLRELPIHEVKIDRSFVRDLASNQGDQALVRSAIQLGHALGLRVVAEGVEDEHALAYLSAEGCDLVQGYFLSRPVPAAKFAEWLQTSPSVYSPAGS